ncbi:ATP-grasp domain-containing protein [Vallicoccus soli]|uniref:ATP-grasp domain-containing protein n=1 Tax=Vallicoccus soli TaxID=2339232 RepID=A0A3A3ZKJ1_9ACTN|nr:hypothetical protein [Vallicoccus soli]RJK96434.1 hypothetical protein D5H78_09430 [Vallicoccus soli]
MRRIALATAEHVRAAGLDDDLAPAVAALDARGADVAVEVWDDASVQWGAFDLVVVRSTWDYLDRRADWLDWASRVPRLLNPPEVLRWSTDKRYLDDLARRGVPVVPTAWDPATVDDLPVSPAGQWVVKPSVSAGSRDTGRWSDPAEALRHARALTDGGRTAMVQPYVASVDEAGETALLHFAGAFSHAVRKAALLRPDEGTDVERFSREDLRGATAGEAELDLARRALAAAGEALEGADLLYARVDVVQADGGPLLLELELAEPSLFLPHGEGAADRFADAVLAAVG